MTTLGDFIVEFLTENGPASTPEMAEAAGNTFGPSVDSRIRTVLGRMEGSGDVVRLRQVPARRLDGRVIGGPRAWVWGLPVDAD